MVSKAKVSTSKVEKSTKHDCPVKNPEHAMCTLQMMMYCWSVQLRQRRTADQALLTNTQQLFTR